MKNALRSMIFLAMLATLVLTTGALRQSVATRSANKVDDSAPIYLPRAELLKPFSLGYHNALADILWFRAISYFGEHYRSDRTYPWLAHICELVTDLDPKAEHVYRFAGLILPWEAGEVEQGIAILEKGNKAIPDSWELAYYLGFMRFFFQDDKEQAARDLQRSSQLPGAHPGVAQLAAMLTRETSGPEATMAFLANLEQAPNATNVRAVIARNMQESMASSAIERINEAIDAHLATTGNRPTSLTTLVEDGYLSEVPRDPFGGVFQLDEEGRAVSSTGKKPERTHVSRARKRALEGKRGDDIFAAD